MDTLAARARAAVNQHGRGSGMRAPFPRMLRQHFAWFQRQHEEFGLTWEGWVEVLVSCGFTGRGRSALTARAVRAAYQREKKRRLDAGATATAEEAVAPSPGMAEAVEAQAGSRRPLKRLTGGVE